MDDAKVQLVVPMAFAFDTKSFSRRADVPPHRSVVGRRYHLQLLDRHCLVKCGITILLCLTYWPDEYFMFLYLNSENIIYRLGRRIAAGVLRTWIVVYLWPTCYPVCDKWLLMTISRELNNIMNVNITNKKMKQYIYIH